MDNTKLMGESIVNGNGRFDAPWWRQAVHQGKSQAMPGAVEFLNEVHNKVLKYSTFQTAMHLLTMMQQYKTLRN